MDFKNKPGNNSVNFIIISELLYFFSLTNCENKTPKRLITIAPQKAGQKPSTKKPILNQFTATYEASQSIKAFITSRNRPKVKITSPNDAIVVSGLSNAFTRPRIIAKSRTVIIALLLSILIPGTRKLVAAMAVADKAQRISVFFIITPF